MPDGNYLVGSENTLPLRSIHWVAGEMWQYHISGGEGFATYPTEKRSARCHEPSVSPDGRYLYFSEDMAPGGSFEYNRDPNGQIYVIKRYDFETGKTEILTGGPGGAAPAPGFSGWKKKTGLCKTSQNQIGALHPRPGNGRRMARL